MRISNISKSLKSFLSIFIIFTIISSTILFVLPDGAQLTPSGNANKNIADLQSNAGIAFNHSPASQQTSGLESGDQHLGYIPELIDYSSLRGVPAPATGLQKYALAYDLRSLGKVSPVKNQNSHGACWAFGTTSSLESSLLTSGQWNFSERNLVNNAGFNGLTPDTGGNALMSAAYLTRWDGPVNETDDPYPGVGDPNPYISTIWQSSPPVGTYAIQKHVQDVYMLPPRQNATDNDWIKWGLTNYGPLATSMYMDTTYFDNTNDTYYYPSSDNSNHMVTVAGWNDSFDRNSFTPAAPGDGAFIVKNSWGSGWGDNGYFNVSYYDGVFAYDGCQAFTAEPPDNYQNIYSYDTLGMNDYLGNYGMMTAYFANVFTADSYEQLRAVSFYAYYPGEPYTISIFRSPDTGSPVHAGSADYTQSGTIDTPGYRTIGLSTPVDLAAGQKFSVVVSVSYPGTPSLSEFSSLIPVEYPLSYYYPSYVFYDNIVASPGHGYVSTNGASWTDIVNYDPSGGGQANVCLKVFTADSAGPSPSPSPSPTPSLPVLQFRSSSYDVNENSGIVTLIVDRIGDTSQEVHVDYAAADGSAKAGINYQVSSPAQLLIPAGASSGYISVNILDDNLYTGHGIKNFTIALSSPVNAELSDTQNKTNVNIRDQDPEPVISFNPVSYGISETGGSISVRVERVNDAELPVSAVLMTRPGTASSPTDYTHINTVVSFAKGETSKTVSIAVHPDNTYSLDDEYFYADLSAPTNGAVLGLSTAYITIYENDPPPVISFPTLSTEVNEDSGAATVYVVRAHNSTDPASVHWYTVDGDGADGAKAGVNYVASNDNVTFYHNEFIKAISIPLIHDQNYSTSPRLRFGIFLSPPLTGNAEIGMQMATTVIINQTDLAPVLQFNTSSVTVDENAGSAAIAVTRANDALGPVTVDYATHDGSAVSPTDYTDTHGTLTFPQGVMSRTVVIPIHNDHAWSPDKMLTISLSNPTGGAVIGSISTAVITITEVDEQPVIELNTTAYYVNENSGVVYINATTSIPTASALDINYITSNGTAMAGINYGSPGVYTPVSGTIRIQPYQSYGLAAINIISDGSYAGDKYFTVSLPDPAPASTSYGANTAATVTIVDTDSKPTVQFTAADYSVNETGGTASVITVCRINSPLTTFTVDYTIGQADDTALLDIDYNATPGTPLQGTLHFTANTTLITIPVNIIDDDNYSGNRTFSVLLDNVVGDALLGTPNVANVTILEQDPLPVTFQFNASSYTVMEDGGSLTVNVTRNIDVPGTMNISYTTYDGTAISGVNYGATAGTLSFSQGVLSQTFEVPIMKDGIFGPDKNFTIFLSGPTGGATLGTPNVTSVTIREADGSIISMGSPSYQVDDRNGTVNVIVNRIDAPETEVTVQYNTGDGTAFAGQNYTAVSGTLTFNENEMSHTISIPILVGRMGSNVTFNVTLSDPAGGAVVGTPNRTVVTIANTTNPLTYHLVPGWNLIGIPLTVSNYTIEGFFPDAVRNNMSTLWCWNESAQEYMFYGTDPNDWYYTQYPRMTGMATGRGYWVEMKNASSFTVYGRTPDGVANFSAGLVKGWNLVAITGKDPQPVASAYPKAFTVWIWNQTAQEYMFYGSDPNDWYYTQYPRFSTLQPGQGNWVEITS